MQPKEIICLDTSMQAAAISFSEVLSIPLNQHPTSSEFLVFDNNQIEFVTINNKQKLSFTHNFEVASIQRRIQSQDQHLLKAFKDKQFPIKSILDVTAGWCRDSFILAENGYQVTAIEQSSLIYYLTQYSLQNYLEHHSLSLTLIHDNAFHYLNETEAKPSAIYLDPMFPATKHQAKNKKEIQLLQSVTKNTQIDDLMNLALNKAGQRVVVKRPLRSDYLNQLKPHFQFKGKTIRFDVYQC